MKTLTLDLAVMYGDHHVIEVRRILLEMSGVEDVYASSTYRIVQVTYDPAKLDGDAIKTTLGEAGYLENMEAPTETGIAAYGKDSDTYFRHTAAYEQTSQVVSFAQQVKQTGRSLWPCPGIGVIKEMDEGE